jgi:glycyl-tRNA synthetase beta chain
MDRELLLEIGCEELPASWLAPLTRQLGERLGAQLAVFRIGVGAPIETHSTPRRLTAAIARISERQTDLEEQVTGPPVAAAFGPDGEPTPAAIGFARKAGIEPSALETVDTPKGRYVGYTRHERGKATVDVLPDVLAATLRDLAFPKQMRWDAWLDDGRGEFTFGRPVRWLLFLHGGRVVPFTIRRNALAQTTSVQDVRSGAVTYGHRVLAGSGRAGRALKVRSVSDYRAKLGEHFVLLEREERHARVARELDAHARRLGGRVSSTIAQTGLMQEVVDLMEYPTVVAGTFAPEFLSLPEEVLATTMIHHQHYFPVADDAGRLLPAFLAVTNIETDNARAIAVNAERVLTARLRDAQFFWESDRKATLESRLARLGTLLFHKRLGSYRLKALRLERLAGWVAADAFDREDEAASAGLAGKLAKADLVTGMVREFTELQGTMGGLYARHEGQPEAVARAIYYHYLPVSVEPGLPPTRELLGPGAVAWAAVSIADKIDSVVGMFAAGERPTGTRDPFALRRQAQGVLRVLVDLAELTGLETAVSLERLVAEAAAAYRAPELMAAAAEEGTRPDDLASTAEWIEELTTFLVDRLRFLFERRGFAYDEVNAVLPAQAALASIAPLDLRRRLEALREVRRSADFVALAVAFKRVKNIAKDVPASSEDLAAPPGGADAGEAAERRLADELRTRGPQVEAAAARADFRTAFHLAAGFRAAVDQFFTDVLVMHDDAQVRARRLALVARLRDLIVSLADISEIAPEPPKAERT